MTFVVNAIKQENKTTNTYTFLLDIDSEQTGRAIIQATGLLLLSIVRYSQEKTDFGPIYTKILYEGIPYEIIAQDTFTLKELCTFFVYCGMEVVDINSFVDIQTPEQVARIISLCKTAHIADLEKTRLEKIQEEEDDQKKRYYEDRMLKRAKVSITWVLDKIETLLQTKRIHIPSKDQRWIDLQLNELKKQRMGSNYEKIKALMQDIFVFLYSLEDAHYGSIARNGATLFSGTVVSMNDLERQVEILEEVKYQSSFGGNILGWRREYASFPILPYFLFLKKDILSLFDDLDLFMYKIYEYLFLFLSMLLVFLAGILIFDQILFLEKELTSLYYSLIQLGWFSFLFFVAYTFKRVNSYRLLLGLLGAVVIVYFVSFPIIEHSFALK